MLHFNSVFAMLALTPDQADSETLDISGCSGMCALFTLSKHIFTENE